MEDFKSKGKNSKPPLASCGGWNHRFNVDSSPMNSRSLPIIKTSKPYISKNGSEVKATIQTNGSGRSVQQTKKSKKKKGKTKERGKEHNGEDVGSLSIVSTCLTPASRRKKQHRFKHSSSYGPMKSLSKCQKVKISSLQSRARPFSLPIIRTAQSPLPFTLEKSYSARDSTSRPSLLKIDVSIDEDMSSNDAQQWHDFTAITEDCETSNLSCLSRLCCIGRGSSAYVYKSVLFPSLQVVADKVVVVAGHVKSGQLIRELNSLRTLLNDDKEQSYSKYIVRLLEVYPNPRDGTISICLEYLQGGSLQDVVRDGGCQDELVLLGLTRQIVSGVAFLHSHRHIHRDMKPGNILIAGGNIMKGEAVVKISDFGISKELEKGHSLADSFLGTFYYMSPERIAGKDYSFTSDIWGAGLSILAVAMGCYPFSKKHDMNSMKATQQLKEQRHVDSTVVDNVAPKNENLDQGGYWHILQSISQRPSIQKLLGFNHTFSSDFCSFLSASLHRNRDQRATATALLSHSFLSGGVKGGSACIDDDLLSTSSTAKNVRSDEIDAAEFESLRLFACRCRVAHDDKMALHKMNSSFKTSPSPKQSAYSTLRREGEVYLRNANVVVRSHEANNIKPTDSSIKYFCCDNTSTHDLLQFFMVLSAYKDFVFKNWEEYAREGETNKQHASENNSNFVAALQLLLETVLSDTSDAAESLSPTAKDVFASFPSFSCFAHQSTLRNLCEQLNVPIDLVKLSFRDLIMDLLESQASIEISRTLRHEKGGDSRERTRHNLTISLPEKDKENEGDKSLDEAFSDVCLTGQRTCRTSIVDKSQQLTSHDAHPHQPICERESSSQGVVGRKQYPQKLPNRLHETIDHLSDNDSILAEEYDDDFNEDIDNLDSTEPTAQLPL